MKFIKEFFNNQSQQPLFKLYFIFPNLPSYLISFNRFNNNHIK
jgi:hypothetical protein